MVTIVNLDGPTIVVSDETYQEKPIEFGALVQSEILLISKNPISVVEVQE